MEKKNLRIVFMGTPEFAVGSLQRLVENGYNVVAVVTQPDKPVGRHGSVLRPSPVKEYALAHGLLEQKLQIAQIVAGDHNKRPFSTVSGTEAGTGSP